MNGLSLPCLPRELNWLNDSLDWQFLSEHSFSIATGPGTDWFIDPAGGLAKQNAAAALFTPPDQDFILSARVTVDFHSTYDAGVLCIAGHESCWAKLCFENSPQNQPMIVSVVTRGVSDDSNAVVIAGNSVHLRVHRRAGVWVFHYSPDGSLWHLVRYFGLPECPAPRVGFLVQSPTGNGCRATFSEIHYAPGTIADLRDGA